MSEPTYTESEMMIAVAARMLKGARTVFVGVGLPNIACNLARHTVAPDMELIYESGVYGARPERLPLSIGDPTLVSGAISVVSMADLFGLVFAARPGRGRVTRRRPDRPLRQPKHHSDRRLRESRKPACRAAAAPAKSPSTRNARS